MREYNGQEHDYRDEETVGILQKNKEKIINYIQDKMYEHKSFGVYDKVNTLIIYFCLDTENLYTAVSGEGISEDIVQGLEEGSILKIYEFKTGYLEESAEEGILYSDDKIARVYKQYKNGEITEEEYKQYEEEVEEWFEEYYKENIKMISKDIEI